MIDVGSEWRTFSNEKNGVDPSRVGGPENPLLNGSDLSTMIGPGRGDASFDEFGVSKYQNRRTVSGYLYFKNFCVVLYKTKLKQRIFRSLILSVMEIFLCLLQKVLEFFTCGV